MKLRWLKIAFQWTFLAAYAGACALILVESAIDGEGSSKQSNAIAARVEDIFHKNYDHREVKELRDFNVAFDRDPSKNVFHTGDVLKYTCSFSPSDASDPTLKWVITKGEGIISIDEANQQITFKSYGEAELNVTSIKKPDLSKVFTFVSEKIPVESIQAEQEISLIAGDANAYSIHASVLPENADEKGLRFISNNPNVIQVDESEGSLKAREPGEATITITSVDNPSVQTSAHVTASSAEKIELELRAIGLTTKEVILNENVPNVLVKGFYTDVGADFDASKIRVDLGGFSNLITVSEKEVTSPGIFSFRLSLNDSSVAEKEGFTDLLGKISVFYEDFPKNETSLSVAVNRLKTITADVIDHSKVQSNVDCHYIYLANLAAQYIEPINISIPFKKGFRASDYKQDGLFIAYDSRLNVSTNSYSLFKAAPENEIDGLEGDVTYNVGGVSILAFHYSYSKVEDSSCTTIEFGLNKFSETETMEFLVGKDYDESDCEGLFETYVSCDSTDSRVSGALKSASLSFSSSDSSVLAILNPNELSSFNFLKTGEAKLIVSFLSDIQEYSLKGVDSPNDYALKLNGEDFTEDGLTIGRGETKTFSVEGLVTTSLKAEKIQAPLNCSIKGSVQPSFGDYVSIKNYAKGSCFVVKGIKNYEDPIPLTIDIHYLDSLLASLTKTISVNYVPVTSLTLSVVLSQAPDGYNSPNATCTIVPLGTILKGQVRTNEGATNKRATYSSSQENVLKVDSLSGLIEAVGVGAAEIKAISQDDLTVSSTMKIQVVDSVSPFELDLTKMDVPSSSKNEDGSYRISLDYGNPYRFCLNTKVPCSAANLVCAYANPDQSHIVRVDSSGLISSLGVGEETVEIGYKNALVSYSVKVTFEVRRNLGFTLEQLALVVRKTIGHFSLFAVTALLSLGFIFLTFSKPIPQYIALGVSSLIGFLVAMGSEFIQLFTAGRYGAWTDVGIDTAGYMTSILIAALVLGVVLLIRRRRKKKTQSKENKEEENAN